VQQLRRQTVAGVGMVALLLAAAGCGSDSANSEPANSTGQVAKVDVGLKEPVSVPKKALRIAVVVAGLGVTLDVREVDGIEKVAKEHGATVKTFDPGFDPTKQQNMYQNIISSGDYDVLITVPLVGQQACTILSQTAPSKNVLVALTTLPICGLENKPTTGDAQWSPGTLGITGFIGNAEGFQAVANACAQKSGGGKTILLNAATGTPSFATMTDAFKAAPGIDVVANYNTNYTPDDAAAKVAASLRQNPDLKVVASTAPPLTQGAIRALKLAGKTPGNDVFVCSLIGGGKVPMAQVEDGTVAADNYVNSYDVGVAVAQSVFDAVDGKMPPRVIVPGTDGAIVKSGTVIWPAVVTKENVAEFPPNGE